MFGTNQDKTLYTTGKMEEKIQNFKHHSQK